MTSVYFKDVCAEFVVPHFADLTPEQQAQVRNPDNWTLLLSSTVESFLHTCSLSSIGELGTHGADNLAPDTPVLGSYQVLYTATNWETGLALYCAMVLHPESGYLRLFWTRESM